MLVRKVMVEMNGIHHIVKVGLPARVRVIPSRLSGWESVRQGCQGASQFVKAVRVRVSPSAVEILGKLKTHCSTTHFWLTFLVIILGSQIPATVAGRLTLKQVC